MKFSWKSRPRIGRVRVTVKPESIGNNRMPEVNWLPEGFNAVHFLELRSPNSDKLWTVIAQNPNLAIRDRYVAWLGFPGKQFKPFKATYSSEENDKQLELTFETKRGTSVSKENGVFILSPNEPWLHHLKIPVGKVRQMPGYHISSKFGGLSTTQVINHWHQNIHWHLE